MPTDMLRVIESSGVIGCAVGMLVRGEEPEFVFHGECARGGAAVSADVLWEAASLSKPVVALLAAEQVNADPGLLARSLSTDLAAFGAADDERWTDVTLMHLLTHSSGLPNWREAPNPLSFDSDPGTPGYSGEGFELALSELSINADLAADRLLDQHLQKLSITRSTFTAGPVQESDSAPEYAIGHDVSGEPVPKHFPSVPKASGSLHTTIGDYMCFLRTIARPAEHHASRSPAVREAAIRAAQREAEILPGFGRTLGWAFAEGADGDVLTQHGDNPGFKHIAAVRPATGEAIVVFTNDDAAGQPLYRQLCMDFLSVEVW